jgi:hypothetical protein
MIGPTTVIYYFSCGPPDSLDTLDLDGSRDKELKVKIMQFTSYVSLLLYKLLPHKQHAVTDHRPCVKPTFLASSIGLNRCRLPPSRYLSSQTAGHHVVGGTDSACQLLRRYETLLLLAWA